MAITTKVKYLIGAILIALFAIFFFGWHIGSVRARNALKPTIDTLNTRLIKATVTINHQKVYIATKEQEILTLREAKKAGEVTNEELRKLNLKKVNEVTRLKLTIDTLLKNVANSGKIIIVHDTLVSKDSNAIMLPFTFDKNDEWLKLHGMFSNDGLLDISLKMDVPIDLWAGINKEKKPVAILTSKNPYLNTISISSIRIDVPKPKKFGIGIIGGYGYGFGTGKAQPIIGLGVSYNLIRF